MLKRTLITIALIAVGLFTSIGYSALVPNNSQVNAQTTRPAATPNNAQLNDIDRQFTIEAGQAGAGNIMLGQLALQRATNPQVKNFANAEIQEQTQVKSDLTRIGQKVGVKPPNTPAPKNRAAMARLSNLQSTNFEQAYMDEGGVNGHLENAALFQREAAFGQNPDLVALANKGLPTIRQHFNTASTITNYQFAQVPRTYNNQSNTSGVPQGNTTPARTNAQ
jgi:putative membrane protein